MAREYRYRYRRRTNEDWEKRSSQRGNDFEGIFKSEFASVYAIRDGENTVRILPPSQQWDTRHYGMDVWVHFQIGVNKSAVICRSRMLNKRCPVCDEAAEAMEAGDSKLAKDLAARKRVVAWIVDRKDPDRGAQLWAMPWTLDRDIAKVARDRETGEIYAVDDPDEGYDVTFDKEGKDIGTKYVGVQISRRPSSVPKAALRKADETPVPDTLWYRSYEEVKKLLDGSAATDDDDDARSARRREDDDDVEEEGLRRRGSPRDEPEDDDERPRRRARDEDDDPPPRRSRRDEPEDDEEDDRRARRSSRDEPEDDPPPRRARRDEPEDDEEDAPPPRRSRRADPEDDDPPPRRRAARDEPEDAEDDPPPRRRRADPDEEDDPPPRRSSNGRSRRDEDDGEEDDGPPRGRFPQDEEEAPPRRRSPDRERETVAATASGLRKRFLDNRR